MLLKFNKLLFRLVKHELIKGSFFLFLGGIIGSLLSFAFNLFLARVLSYSSYGTYVSLVSFSTLITVPASSSLTVVLVRFATSYFSKNKENKAAVLYKSMLLFWGLVSFVIFFAIASISHLIQLYLHITDIRFILIIALSVAFSYFAVVNTAFLRSLMKFHLIAFNNLIGHLAKVIVGVSLVLLGFGVIGALTGVLVVPLIIFSLGFIPLSYLIKKKADRKGINTDKKELINYAIPVSIGLISLSSFIYSDMILVKHFFSPTMAGYYGGLSIVGKVILYSTASISSVMFPLVVKRYTMGENYKNVYFLSLLLIGLPSIAVTIFYFFFPDLSIKFFLGGKNYLNVVPYLGLFGIFVTLYNFLSITINFLLSLKKTIVAYFIPFFAFLQIVLIYIFHSNFYDIIYSSIFSISLLLTLLIIYSLKHKLFSSKC